MARMQDAKQARTFLRQAFFPALSFALVYLSSCGSGVSSLPGGSLTMSSISTGGQTSVTLNAPAGSFFSRVMIDQGAQFTSSNICTGATIFGRAGSATCVDASLSCTTPGYTSLVSLSTVVQSGAPREVTATQISAAQESGTYAGADLPSGYRDIPVVASDDDAGSTSPITRLTRGTNIWNAAAARIVCGMGIETIAGRITDCDTRHSTKPSWDATSGDERISWDGSKSGNGLAGEGSWTLVTVYSSSLANGNTCNATCFEVWRDDRTGLLWSDRIGSASGVTTNAGNFNWCIASGNTENAGGIDCTNGASGYNTASVSICAEAPGLTTPIGASSSTNNSAGAAPGAAWGTTGTAIRDAKGGMLKTANSDPAGGGKSPSVAWRLPTLWDWKQADLDGVRSVLPNFYTVSDLYFSSTVNSTGRNNAWYIISTSGTFGTNSRTVPASVHCVGR